MISLITPISNDDFKRNVKIRFNNILDGFDSFENFTITSNNENAEEKFINFITDIFESNSNACYIDFYLSRLSVEDKEKMMSLIPKEDKSILELIFNSDFNSDFFKIKDKNILPFLIRLCTREIFFITFYFTETPITIWGNYKMKFPCFTENTVDLEYYKTKAHNLEIL